MKFRNVLQPGELFAQRHRQRVAHAADVAYSSLMVLLIGHEAVDAVTIRMEAIIT